MSLHKDCFSSRLSGTNLRGHTGIMESVVIRDPGIMSGEPTFRRTRVLVRTLFDYLEAGHSLERFLDGFPTVTRAMALRALEEAKGIAAGPPLSMDSRVLFTSRPADTELLGDFPA
jgi:uncharacterized protein (DUF433 family)